MQEEIDNRTIALSVRTGEGAARLTKDVFKAAIRKFLAEYDKHSMRMPDHKIGKQSIKSLMSQGKQLASLEITDENIGSFSRIARKYGIDFSLKKDLSSEGHYMVFFKAQDTDVITEAFKEYSSKALDKDKKPFLREKLQKLMQKAKSINMQRQMERVKTRGLDR